MKLPPLKLKKNEERRLLQGHLWIYSNEIDTAQSPLSGFVSGQLVDIFDYRGGFLGKGYVNPHTLLCARLLSRNSQCVIDENFFIERIESALQLRQQLFEQPYYRLIYGESDYLPGLIVDRYDDLLVAQITTAGMESLQDYLIAALQAVLKPRAILLRNDHSMRKMEGLLEYIAPAFGEPAQECSVQENGVQFKVNPWSGQKTGWFYDHRENRAMLRPLVQGKRILDMFSYAGAWSVQAAVFGAAAIWAVDSSAPALAACRENAELNRVGDLLTTCQSDAFDQLKKFAEEKQQFDVIILDPPAFIKKRKDHAQGFLAYKRLNALAMRLLSPGGFLISASCSHHLSVEELQRCVLSAGVGVQRDIQIIARGRQGFDHPQHPAIPETEYLKTLFCRA